MYYIINFFLTFLKADVRMGLMQASRKEGREKIETGSGDSAKGPEIISESHYVIFNRLYL